MASLRFSGSPDKSLYGDARGLVVPVQFFHTRRKPSRSRGTFKNLFGGLNPAFRFENTQKIESAEFNDPFAITHDDTSENRAFLAQQHAAFVTQ